ncbi:MAG: magnesium transporter MgtE [Candidatus Tyloplasma litorale]|nr:MAG: magnesium transporter MgtE [Mycoplasmatales bacterium]
MKDKKILLQGLLKFVEERNVKKVRHIFNEFHPSDLYKSIKDWPTEKAVLLLRLLKEEESSILFSQFNPEQQERVIEALTSDEIKELFEEMYTDEAVDILDELPAKITRKVLKVADKKTREKLNSVLRYEKNHVGYHMVVEYIAIPLGITIKEAKNLIAKQINIEELEIVGNIFVYDKKTESYVGYITPSDIISNSNDELIDGNVTKIKAIKTSDYMSSAEKAITNYDIPAVPVVNSKNKIVGVIEADDVIEWYEEASEAVLEQAAIKVIDKPYLEINVLDLFKSRVPWIIVLLVVGTLTQIIILGFQSIWVQAGIFEAGSQSGAIELSGICALSIATAVSLSSSINDASGNSGSQTSSTLVRAIALGEIRKGNYLEVLFKEFKVSILIGLSVMIAAFIRIIIVWLFFGYFGGFGNSWVDGTTAGWMILIAFVASVSFLLTIIIGNFVGAVLPIIADKYKIDGAIFSGPVQTTVVDIITILVYFSLTTAIFVPLTEILNVK